MSYDIISEIRRMEKKYYAHCGKRGEIVCLDANAEARLAAYLVFKFSCDEAFYVEYLPTVDSDIMEILEDGIRPLGIIICGMELRFDCPSFCIETKFHPT